MEYDYEQAAKRLSLLHDKIRQIKKNDGLEVIFPKPENENVKRAKNKHSKRKEREIN